jgi:hypothetical protein
MVNQPKSRSLTNLILINLKLMKEIIPKLIYMIAFNAAVNISRIKFIINKNLNVKLNVI